MNIKKRDGTIVPFVSTKIHNAIYKALEAIGLPSDSTADKVTGDVVSMIGQADSISVEEVQDLVETALMKRGLNAAAKAYILYRDAHARARQALHVRKRSGSRQSVTDRSMRISEADDEQVAAWDRKALEKRLMDTCDTGQALAQEIGKRVETCIIDAGLADVSDTLVREMANNVIRSMGYKFQLKDESVYTVPSEFVRGLIESKINENSNIQANTPETVNETIAEYVLKKYALSSVFTEKVKEAHDSGLVYLHDLGFPVRAYCSSHSIEYIKKYGLKGLRNLSTTSKPAKSASVLTGHFNTFLASMQAYYAGALGFGFVNVFYAPLLIGMEYDQLHQVAQELIFNGSQNAFSRGSQTIFLDLNIHSGVPGYLKNVPAVGAGGKYMWLDAKADSLREWRQLDEFRDETGAWCLRNDDGEVLLRETNGVQTRLYDETEGRILTYGDFEHETQAFAHALLDVWGEGDANGHVFEFPKCDFHVSAESFTDINQYEVFQHACKLAAHNGSTYFIFDRDAVSLASCCRLRVQITDMSLLLHPERLRTVGLQNVTINIPQCAYRAAHAGKPTLDGMLEQVGAAMDIAAEAHLQKRAFLADIMKPGCPMAQMGAVANDGRPYMDLDTATYIIGLIGVNDAVHYLLGKEMHESDEAMDMALKITGFMYLRCKEYTKKYGLTFKLEESPAESASRKLAKSDLVNWREDALKVYKGGDEEHAYYTNSIHLAPDAPVDLLERIEKQAKFNSIIEAGAIMHAFIGEECPNYAAIAKIVHAAFQQTQAAQITFSPEFTYCNRCGKQFRGLMPKCPDCGSDDVEGETRIVGYFSKVSNFNLSKLAELRDRQHGRYRVETNL